MYTALEVCQDCIWWDGDNSGMQGQCNQADARLIVGRYEECVNFLARYLTIPTGETDD